MHTRVFVSETREGQQILVLFYEAACVFSNFYPAEFKIKPVEEREKIERKVKKDGEKELKFSCSEQYFMYQKAVLVGDLETARKIREESNPMKMKVLGRKLEMSKEQLHKWSQISQEAMYNACFAKFAQNKDIRAFLFRTHGMKLVEASPSDTIWGIGPFGKNDKRAENEETWRGSNWLGKVLDRVRDELWEREEFRSEREAISAESLETRRQLLEHYFKI
ncbi:unnamed protein product [Caenorhabditis sp. 36 PRJEB53466]|nr:unnamed protein product [Caenorhabditis sp. 36 PRJEB53466]